MCMHYLTAMNMSIRLVREQNQRKQKQQANFLFMDPHIHMHELARKNKSEDMLRVMLVFQESGLGVPGNNQARLWRDHVCELKQQGN